MVELVEEQQLDREPPTYVTQATTWWEVVLALVKLRECGLAVHLSVKVCCYYMPIYSDTDKHYSWCVYKRIFSDFLHMHNAVPFLKFLNVIMK